MSVRPSCLYVLVCMYVLTLLPLDGYRLNLILGSFMKNLSIYPDLVKIGKIIGHFT